MKFEYFKHHLPKINSRVGREHSNNNWEEIISPDVMRQPFHSHRSLGKVRSSVRLHFDGLGSRVGVMTLDFCGCPGA